MLKEATLVVLVAALVAASTAVVPPSQRFHYVNTGPVADYPSEYFTDYRPLDPFAFPFRLCFYNATPDKHYLAIKMGSHRTQSVFRWVWEANRSRPVRENATLTLGADGDLVLADADGSVAWRTGTANKGVVGMRLMSNGNLVLYDSKGKFVWQSFDYPTDTLLVGQSLRSSGPLKLTSRAAIKDASDGPHTLVLEPRRFAVYLTVKQQKAPILYYESSGLVRVYPDETLTSLALEAVPNQVFRLGSDIGLRFTKSNTEPELQPDSYVLARTKYNGTLSALRLDYDGNLRLYTFFTEVDTESWDEPFALFRKTGGLVDECGWPSRCGALGVCEDSQCIGCPSPRGLSGWSSSCAPPAKTACGGRVDYFSVRGVEHFANRWDEGTGPMKLAACRDLCSKDCTCLGFFYREESSKCLLAPVLGTITKVDNSSHVAYIKK